MALDPTQKTTLDLITGAMRKTGQYAPGEAITAADANDALDVLNALLDSLSNESKLTFDSTENIVTLTPGQAIYTVGAGGQINVPRPLQITDAYSRLTTSASSVDFPCGIRDLADYASIGLKLQPGPWAKWVFYNPTFPLGTLYFWPVPTQTVEFHFWTTGLLNFVSLTQQLTLPQGYYNFLQFKLAEMLCIDYGVPISPDLARLTRQFESVIRSTNEVPDRSIRIDAGIATRNNNDAGWFLTGGF